VVAPAMIVSTKFLLEYFLCINCEPGLGGLRRDGIVYLQIICPHKPRIMCHCQFHIMQKNKISQVYLKPVIPRIARFKHRLQHFEDLLELRLQDLGDDDEVDLEVDYGRDGNLGVIGAGGIGVGGLTESLGADDAPGLFDEAAADPEFQGTFNQGKMLLMVISDGFNLVN
jgi:hypothetical protein